MVTLHLRTTLLCLTSTEPSPKPPTISPLSVTVLDLLLPSPQAVISPPLPRTSQTDTGTMEPPILTFSVLLPLTVLQLTIVLFIKIASSTAKTSKQRLETPMTRLINGLLDLLLPAACKLRSMMSQEGPNLTDYNGVTLTLMLSVNMQPAKTTSVSFNRTAVS